MNDMLVWGLAGSAGLGLGVFFFGGLWWTVRRGVVSKRPAQWFIGSLLLRMGTIMAGFYLVADGHWQRLLACLAGFAIGRLLLMRFTGPPRPEKEPRHAP